MIVFMQYVLVGLVAYFIYLLFQKIKFRLPVVLSLSHQINFLFLWRFVLSNREIQKKIGITVIILLLVQIIRLIPLPWVNYDKISMLFIIKSQSAFVNWLSYLYSISRFSLFALALTPYLAACVTLQFVSLLLPNLRSALFGGEKGRHQVKKYTYYLTAFLAFIQAFFMARWFNLAPLSLLNQNVPLILIVLVLFGAVFLLLYLASLINRFGIGNGVALIVVVDYCFSLVLSTFKAFDKHPEIYVVVFTCIIFIFLLYVAYYFTEKECQLHVKKADGCGFSLPIRFSWVSNWPIGWASFVYIILATLCGRIIGPFGQKIESFMLSNDLFMAIGESILIIVILFVFINILFDMKAFKHLLNKYNLMVVEKNSKLKGDEYIDSVLTKVILVISLIIAGLIFIPRLLVFVLSFPLSVTYLLSAGGVLLLAGVFLDLMRQIEFYYEKSKDATNKYAIAYIASDEIEAKIVCEQVKANGIHTLIESLRFTWGIPIHTIVDEYRLYVPENRVEEARNMIG